MTELSKSHSTVDLSYMKLPHRALQCFSQAGQRVIEPTIGLLCYIEGRGIEKKYIDALTQFKEGIEESIANNDFRNWPVIFRKFQEVFDKLGPIKTLPTELDSWNFQPNIRSILISGLSVMASAIDRQRNLNSEKGFVYIGEGGFNWAMSDGTRVILISNGREDTDYFENYGTRKWCGEILKKHGLEQPNILGVGSFPFYHCIIEHVKGRLISDKYWSTNPLDKDFLFRSLEKLGSFFHDLSSIPVSGFGELKRVEGSRDYAGKYETLEEYLSSSFLFQFKRLEDNKAVLDRILQTGILTESELSKIREGSIELTRLVDAPILIHGDHHTSNFFINPDGKIVAIDWDFAKVLHPADFISLLYREYVIQEHSQLNLEDRKKTFEIVTRPFFEDCTRTECTMKNAYMFYVVKKLSLVIGRVTNGQISDEELNKELSELRDAIRNME